VYIPKWAHNTPIIILIIIIIITAKPMVEKQTIRDIFTVFELPGHLTGVSLSCANKRNTQ